MYEIWSGWNGGFNTEKVAEFATEKEARAYAKEHDYVGMWKFTCGEEGYDLRKPSGKTVEL